MCKQTINIMPNKVFYEWSVETIDEFGDIEDSSFYDTIEEVPTLEDNQRLCLVRNEGNDDEGLTHRLWAYVKDGKLPEYFSDSNECEVGYKVPLKFKGMQL